MSMRATRWSNLRNTTWTLTEVPLITDLVGFVQATARELAGPFPLATPMRNSSKRQIGR